MNTLFFHRQIDRPSRSMRGPSTRACVWAYVCSLVVTQIKALYYESIYVLWLLWFSLKHRVHYYRFLLPHSSDWASVTKAFRFRFYLYEILWRFFLRAKRSLEVNLFDYLVYEHSYHSHSPSATVWSNGSRKYLLLRVVVCYQHLTSCMRYKTFISIPINYIIFLLLGISCSNMICFDRVI